MQTYIVTVFDKTGEKLLDEAFEAKNDTEAKVMGEKILKEKQFANHTSRVTSPKGKLVLFHR
jgi:hypothetical protein